MRIIRARLKPFGGSAEFISVKGRIKGLIEKNREDIFHFVIDEDGVKTVKEFGPDNINPELVNQSIIILDGPYYAKFNEDGTIDVVEEQNESIFSRKSEDDKIAIQFIDRLKKIKKSDKACNIQRLDDDNKPEWFVTEEPRYFRSEQAYIIKFEDVDMIIIDYMHTIEDSSSWIRDDFYRLYLGNNISNMCEKVDAKESYLAKIFRLALQISENKESKRRIGNLSREINPAAEPIEESIFSRKSEDDKIAIHFIDRLKKIKKSNKACNVQKLDNDNSNAPEWFVAEEPRKYYIKQGYIIKFEDVDMVIVSYTFGIHDERVYFYLGNNISNMCEEVEAEESYLDKIFYLTLDIWEDRKNKKRLNNLNIEINTAAEPIEESLPRERSVKQLKKLRSMTKGIDIGDRISDLNKQGANIDYYRNPIDSGIESFEDFEKNNKKFIPSWNLKHLLSPFPKKKKSKDK